MVTTFFRILIFHTSSKLKSHKFTVYLTDDSLKNLKTVNFVLENENNQTCEKFFLFLCFFLKKKWHCNSFIILLSKVDYVCWKNHELLRLELLQIKEIFDKTFKIVILNILFWFSCWKSVLKRSPIYFIVHITNTKAHTYILHSYSNIEAFTCNYQSIITH